jgi:hypothetical protein
VAYADPDAARVVRNLAIKMPLISHRWIPDPSNKSVIRVREPAHHGLRRAAEVLAYQFKRETPFDFAPYRADARNAAQEVWLLASPVVAVGYSEAISGAVGIVLRPEGWVVHWLWVHPWERGLGLIDSAWPQISGEYDDLDFEGPFTVAGAHLVKRLSGRDVQPITRRSLRVHR